MQNGDQRKPEPAALTPGERELECALGSLRPGAPAGVDRARALFDAGVAVGRRRARAWQGAAGVLAVALVASVAMRMPAGGDDGGDRRLVSPVVRAVEPSNASPLGKVAATAVVARTPQTLPVAVVANGVARDNEYMLPPLPMPGERPGYLRLRDAMLERGPASLLPADAAAPLWMADPAARRVLRPAQAMRS